MRPDHHVDAPVGQVASGRSLRCCAGERKRLSSSTPHRVRRVPVGERLRVLAGEQRRRREHRRLRPVLHGLEHGTDGDLRLAEPDVAADEPVHRAWLLHVGLDVGDGRELVVGLHEREGRLQLGLPRRVRTEGAALRRPRRRRYSCTRSAATSAAAAFAQARVRCQSAPPIFDSVGDLRPLEYGVIGLDLVDREVEPVRIRGTAGSGVVPNRPAHRARRHLPRSAPPRADGARRSCPPRDRRRTRPRPAPSAWPAGAACADPSRPSRTTPPPWSRGEHEPGADRRHHHGRAHRRRCRRHDRACTPCSASTSESRDRTRRRWRRTGPRR